MSNSHLGKRFGTAPVFFTAISTILGAVLFLRFGYAVGEIGFFGLALIIVLGHLVTVPTALAISEIATNKRVEGGGEYFIISRSFGLNIGATIGIALFLSQAISVAFYVIAFTESFEMLFNYVAQNWGVYLPRQVVSLPAMGILSVLILTKGANIGVKTLYVVCVILFIALSLFFFGSTDFAASNTFTLSQAGPHNMSKFFMVFAIVFPAFTGMTAGVGLSGELKNPRVSIPLGTTLATLSGMVIYFFVAYKLASSASVEDLLNVQLVMGKIAIGGDVIVPLGLAAATISSAIGSVMVAPRTLQALAVDVSFPSVKLNRWLSSGRKKDKEPIHATIVTLVIAFVFVGIGDVDAVAEIISMFFMVTYGALCLISFLNHFGSSPSYRPSFRSKWYISFIGFVVSIWVMFKINMAYAIVAYGMITLLYVYINSYHTKRKGLSEIFTNAIYQLNRNLQVYLQKAVNRKQQKEWRPSAICISKNSFKRDSAFRLLSWISYKYGFGTYLHRIEGYYSKATVEQAEQELDRLLKQFADIPNYVFTDTIISPSYTSAIAQCVQVPGVAGMENNMVIFEYEREDREGLSKIIENMALVKAGNFDIGILSCSQRQINYSNDIHLWFRSSDTENANLMILLSFIISNHPDWKKSDIKIFSVCKSGTEDETRTQLEELIVSGRIPISQKNIHIISEKEEVTVKDHIMDNSEEAGFVIIGFQRELLKHEGPDLFAGLGSIGNILFVNSHSQKAIE